METIAVGAAQVLFGGLDLAGDGCVRGRAATLRLGPLGLGSEEAGVSSVSQVRLLLVAWNPRALFTRLTGFLACIAVATHSGDDNGGVLLLVRLSGIIGATLGVGVFEDGNCVGAQWSMMGKRVAVVGARFVSQRVHVSVARFFAECGIGCIIRWAATSIPLPTAKLGCAFGVRSCARRRLTRR